MPRSTTAAASLLVLFIATPVAAQDLDFPTLPAEAPAGALDPKARADDAVIPLPCGPGSGHSS